MSPNFAELSFFKVSQLLKKLQDMSFMKWTFGIENVFLVFTHVTFALTTVAIRHVGAQTNALNRDESLNRFFA